MLEFQQAICGQFKPPTLFLDSSVIHTGQLRGLCHYNQRWKLLESQCDILASVDKAQETPASHLAWQLSQALLERFNYSTQQCLLSPLSPC